MIYVGTSFKDDYLLHYGVKGMRWGVWNAETSARYSGGTGSNRFSKGDDSQGVGSRLIKRATDSVSTRLATRRAVSIRRKELGIKSRKARKAFDKLREETLASTDPEVVAKGMRTLTDSELGEKIARMEKESAVTKLANEQARDRIETDTREEQRKFITKQRRATGIGGTLVKTAGVKALDTAHDIAVSAGKAYIQEKTGLNLGGGKSNGNDPFSEMAKVTTDILKSGKQVVDNSKKSSQQTQQQQVPKAPQPQQPQQPKQPQQAPQPKQPQQAQQAPKTESQKQAIDSGEKAFKAILNESEERKSNKRSEPPVARDVEEQKKRKRSDPPEPPVRR